MTIPFGKVCVCVLCSKEGHVRLTAMETKQTGLVCMPCFTAIRIEHEGNIDNDPLWVPGPLHLEAYRKITGITYDAPSFRSRQPIPIGTKLFSDRKVPEHNSRN